MSSAELLPSVLSINHGEQRNIQMEESDLEIVVCDDEISSANQIYKYIYDVGTEKYINVHEYEMEESFCEACDGEDRIFIPTVTMEHGIDMDENDVRSSDKTHLDETLLASNDDQETKFLEGVTENNIDRCFADDGKLQIPIYNVNDSDVKGHMHDYEDDLEKFMYLNDVNFRKTCFPELWSSSSDISLLSNRPGRLHSGSYDIRYTSTSLILLNNKLRQEISRLRRSDKRGTQTPRPEMNPGRHIRALSSCSMDYHLRCYDSSSARFEPSSGMRWLKSVTPTRFLEKYSVNPKRHRTCLPTPEPSISTPDPLRHSEKEKPKSGEKDKKGKSKSHKIISPYQKKQKKKESSSK